MALAKLGGGVIALSGKIAGNVFSRNRSGNIVRAWANPVSPNTARQQAVKTIMQTLSTRWSNVLTAVQRAQWDAYAAAVLSTNRLGETIQLTGANYYVGNNAVILSAGGPIVDDGPGILSKPDSDPLFAVVVDEAAQEISVTFDPALPWNIIDDGFMLVQMGTPINLSRNFFKGPYRIAGALDGNTAIPLTSPQVLPAPFPVQVGQKVFAQARVMEPDGRVSAQFRTSIAVSA